MFTEPKEIPLGYRAVNRQGPQPWSSLIQRQTPFATIDPNVSRPIAGFEADALSGAEWTGPNRLLWESFPSLVQWLTYSGFEDWEKTWTIVEIGLWADVTTLLLLECLKESQGVNFLGPFSIETNGGAGSSSLLGYDVADQGQISAIHNVCFGAFERNQIWNSLANDLNESGLFDDPETAERFAFIASVLCPEHAPFLVYSIRQKVA